MQINRRNLCFIGLAAPLAGLAGCAATGTAPTPDTVLANAKVWAADAANALQIVAKDYPTNTTLQTLAKNVADANTVLQGINTASGNNWQAIIGTIVTAANAAIPLISGANPAVAAALAVTLAVLQAFINGAPAMITTPPQATSAALAIKH